MPNNEIKRPNVRSLVIRTGGWFGKSVRPTNNFDAVRFVSCGKVQCGASMRDSMTIWLHEPPSGAYIRVRRHSYAPNHGSAVGACKATTMVRWTPPPDRLIISIPRRLSVYLSLSLSLYTYIICAIARLLVEYQPCHANLIKGSLLLYILRARLTRCVRTRALQHGYAMIKSQELSLFVG